MQQPKLILSALLDPLVFSMIRESATIGSYNGGAMTPYFMNCRWWWKKYECLIIFTRDTGYHTSGWWKNPDYERCWHLSISFPGGVNQAHLKIILDGLFCAHKNLVWVEPPYSAEGKQNDVWHYRLFCDEWWRPIKPRGEVYSTHFTEVGWKSFSELHKA